MEICIFHIQEQNPIILSGLHVFHVSNSSSSDMRNEASSSTSIRLISSRYSIPAVFFKIAPASYTAVPWPVMGREGSWSMRLAWRASLRLMLLTVNTLQCPQYPRTLRDTASRVLHTGWVSFPQKCIPAATESKVPSGMRICSGRW